MCTKPVRSSGSCPVNPDRARPASWSAASAGPTRVFSTRACTACAANLAEGRPLPSYACVRVNVSVLVAVVRIVVVTIVDRAAASS